MMQPIRLFIDGGVIEGEGIYWSVARDRSNKIEFWSERERNREYKTNNEAEYLALISAFRHLADRKSLAPNVVILHSDSQLVVKQFTGLWKVREPRIQSLWDRAHHLKREVEAVGFKVMIKWVPRRENFKRLGH